MPWLSDWFQKFTQKNIDLDDIKQKILSATATSDDLMDYVADIEYRDKLMVKDLRNMYKKYNITFTGFKSFDMGCDYLRESIKDHSEAAYNNLIKLESMITGEQQRHLALIKMAIMANGKRVMEQINRDPEDKQVFEEVFGVRDPSGRVVEDGVYQHLWSELHKLSEYILVQKNKIYH